MNNFTKQKWKISTKQCLLTKSLPALKQCRHSMITTKTLRCSTTHNVPSTWLHDPASTELKFPHKPLFIEKSYRCQTTNPRLCPRSLSSPSEAVVSLRAWREDRRRNTTTTETPADERGSIAPGREISEDGLRTRKTMQWRWAVRDGLVAWSVVLIRLS